MPFAPSNFSRVLRLLRCAALLLPLVLGAMFAPSCMAQSDDTGTEPQLPGGRMLRGTVTAVKGNSLTLKTEAGELYQVTATDNTHVIHARQTAKLEAIKVGDGVGAGGVLDAPNKTLHAAFIGFIDAEEVRRAQAELGKSYILGRVLAINELRLTIQRPDGIKQIIAVDESTSFRRGGRSGRGLDGIFGVSGEDGARQGEAPSGESITLADIKVSDTVIGKGALKNGVFLPSELHVSDAARSRRGGETAGADAKAATVAHP